VWRRLPRGPLAVIKDIMTAKMEVPLNLGKTACEHLQDLQINLEMAHNYAKEHAEKFQGRYMARYILRTEKSLFKLRTR